MPNAIALPWSDLPLSLIERHRLDLRVHERGGEREVRFDWRTRPTVLPVWWDGGLRVVRWGCRARRSKLPPTGWTWQATVEAGRWAALCPEPVTVPAAYCYTGGVWYRVKEGVQGLLVTDERGEPVVYLIVERPTRYFRVMTRAEWAPALVNEVI
ncbi:MAG: hypothetical protein U0871_01865 [Gemmataceae bacterium]